MHLFPRVPRYGQLSIVRESPHAYRLLRPRPVSDEQTSLLDPRWIGIWRDDERSVWTVQRHRAWPGVLHFCIERRRQPALLGCAFTTRIGRMQIVSLPAAGAGLNQGLYAIYRYRFLRGQALQLAAISEEELMDAEIEGLVAPSHGISLMKART